MFAYSLDDEEDYDEEEGEDEYDEEKGTKRKERTKRSTREKVMGVRLRVMGELLREEV